MVRGSITLEDDVMLADNVQVISNNQCVYSSSSNL